MLARIAASSFSRMFIGWLLPLPPCFHVSRGNKGDTGEWLASRGNKGVSWVGGESVANLGTQLGSDLGVARNRSGDNEMRAY